jgi:hypothetical protein
LVSTTQPWAGFSQNPTASGAGAAFAEPGAPAQPLAKPAAIEMAKMIRFMTLV